MVAPTISYFPLLPLLSTLYIKFRYLLCTYSVSRELDIHFIHGVGILVKNPYFAQESIYFLPNFHVILVGPSSTVW